MPRFIQKWACESCGSTNNERDVIVEHEKTCAFNPENRSCYSCSNQGNDGYPFGGREKCKAGVDNYDEIEEDTLSCLKWKLKQR